MNESLKKASRWELGCIVFNSLVFKLFSLYPDMYVYYGGSASWNNSLYCGIIFLIVLWLMTRLYSPYAKEGIINAFDNRGKKGVSAILKALFLIYFAISSVMAIYFVCGSLRETAFPNSPLWYTGIFIVLASVVTVICGMRAVLRMHSLCAFGVGLTLILIGVLGFEYGDISNLTPVFGKGVFNVYGKGLLSLLMYSDIFVLFFIPYREERGYRKTVMLSGVLAVALNVLIMLSFSLNFPYELAEKTRLIIYPLTKGASIVKLPLRLDVAYLLSLIVSGILYLSVSFKIIKSIFKGFSLSFKKVGVPLMSIVLCLTLCGCYDSSEIEERGYIIAVGIDKGKYTFQLSNPLQSGGSMNGEEKKESENKSVDNITVEAEDFFTARTKLQSHISKETDMSHIKLIVLSKDVAYEDAYGHSSLMLKEREVRPATKVCLVDSAEDFLRNVKPTMEESTVRYYELLFEKEMPYAPVTELRDFVGRCLSKGYDAIAPYYSGNGLSGMGIFNNGKLYDVLSGEEVFIYNILKGELQNSGFYDGGDGAILSSDGKPEITVDVRDDVPYVNINVNLKIYGAENVDESSAVLKAKCEEFLYKTRECDILGVGRHIKKKCLTQKQWEEYEWDRKYKNAVFPVNVMVKTVKNI